MSDYNDLMMKLQSLDKNYRKEVLKERQKKIFNLYEELYEDLDELIKNNIVNIEIDSDDYDVTVIINSSQDLLISELDVILNQLVVLADIKNIKIKEGKIVLKLWFRCWEYQSKSS